MKCLSRIFALALLASITGTVFAGKIVVNHDEWTLSNTGFSQSGTTMIDAPANRKTTAPLSRQTEEKTGEVV